MGYKSEIPYNHAEAFCLMQYRCETCGTIEHLWNSRDGVTPMIIGCSKEGCNGHAAHISWQSDRCIAHLMPLGIRWFINLTKDKYKSILLKRIPDTEKDKDQIVQEILDDMQPGEPDILEACNIEEYIQLLKTQV